ncbi:MAG: helix-turn-helix domain-containing protein [Lachnospiraceae bacterium]|nr:helix-turn-helix domain-containing protein [Lachnospiraceae bacterium]
MYEEIFPIRLNNLRTQKGVSARDMSLSIGQNPGYINNIESGKALPSMTSFFCICEYLNITPQEFFDLDNQNPELFRETITYMKKLKSKQLENILAVIKDIVNE